MSSKVIQANDLATTLSVGRALAALIDGPVSIALNGTLGAGKTTLAKAMISALGVEFDSISSPTFTICQEYAGADWSIYHVDLYRVVDTDELLELGTEQWLDGDGVAVIEWADRFSDVNSGCDLQVDITVVGKSSREICIRTPEDCRRFPDVSSLNFSSPTKKL